MTLETPESIENITREVYRIDDTHTLSYILETKTSYEGNKEHITKIEKISIDRKLNEAVICVKQMGKKITDGEEESFDEKGPIRVTQDLADKIDKMRLPKNIKYWLNLV